MDPTLFPKWIEERSGLAAWIQAVGSIAAIIASAMIAAHGTREARRASWRVERDAVNRFADFASWTAYQLWPYGDKLRARPRPGMFVWVMFGRLVSKRRLTNPFTRDATSIQAGMEAMAVVSHGMKQFQEQMSSARYPSLYDKEYVMGFLERLESRGVVISNYGDPPGMNVPGEDDVLMLCDWCFQDAIAAAKRFNQTLRTLE